MTSRSPSDDELLAARRLLAHAERTALDDVLAVRAEAARLLAAAHVDADRLRSEADADRTRARNAREASEAARASDQGTRSELAAQAELDAIRAELNAERTRMQDPLTEVSARLRAPEAPRQRLAHDAPSRPETGDTSPLRADAENLLHGAEAEVAALNRLRDDLQAQVDAFGRAPNEPASEAPPAIAHRVTLEAEQAASVQLAAAEAEARQLLEETGRLRAEAMAAGESEIRARREATEKALASAARMLTEAQTVAKVARRTAERTAEGVVAAADATAAQLIATAAHHADTERSAAAAEARSIRDEAQRESERLVTAAQVTAAERVANADRSRRALLDAALSALDEARRGLDLVRGPDEAMPPSGGPAEDV